MAISPLPPRGRTGAVLWWVGAACAAAALGAAGLAALAHPDPAPLARLAAVAPAVGLVFFAAALHQRRTAARLHTLLAAALDETDHLVAARLPAVAEGRDPVPAAREGSPLDRPHQAAVDLVAKAVGQERRLRETDRAVFLSMASDIQSMALAQQRGLDEMQRSHDAPETLEGLMRADHAAAQLAHRAQTMKILCGSLPDARRTAPVPLHDVVRGAQSRILEYQRVRVHGGLDVHAAPEAAEALVHAVAELLDNATRHSPADRVVVVSVAVTDAGAVIAIDDAGSGLAPRDLRAARARLTPQTSPLPLSLLAASRPQLGLLTVGRLAGHYGFTADLTPDSAYGGLRACVNIPLPLLAPVPLQPAAAVPQPFPTA